MPDWLVQEVFVQPATRSSGMTCPSTNDVRRRERWPLEQNVEEPAELDCHVRKDWWSAWSSLIQCVLGRGLVQADQHRLTLSKRGIAVRPFGRAVSDEVRPSHAHRLNAWIVM